jgi:hypothetical protein
MTYPFQTEEYQSLFKKHFVPDVSSCIKLGDTEYELLPDKRAVLLGMKPVLNNQEVTDYGDMPHISKETISSHLKELKNRGASVVEYNYVREDSTLYKLLVEQSSIPPTIQEVAPFITLPISWEAYLESLERTDRKELKRKFKRLDTVPHEFKVREGEGKEKYFDHFINLHKLSDHNKDLFMTPPMEAFFKELFMLTIPGWEQKLSFLSINNEPAAAIFYFENEEELLLYNSGYNPEQKFYSAGLLLCAQLIQQSINMKKKKFDFLRGNERYKYDLGGKDVSLFKFMLSLH